MRQRAGEAKGPAGMGGTRQRAMQAVPRLGARKGDEAAAQRGAQQAGPHLGSSSTLPLASIMRMSRSPCRILALSAAAQQWGRQAQAGAAGRARAAWARPARGVRLGCVQQHLGTGRHAGAPAAPPCPLASRWVPAMRAHLLRCCMGRGLRNRWGTPGAHRPAGTRARHGDG